MIRSLFVLLVLFVLSLPRAVLAEEAQAPEAQAPEPSPADSEKTDDTLEGFRTPLDALTEREIGAASKSVRFDWRKSTIGFGLIGSELLERNNFGSTRLGLMARKPFGSFVGEVAITRAFTWGTDSTEKLALTPYRQHGRPSRFELDINVGYPLAEGVVTALPGFFPATELVFSANAGFRYLFYPGAMGGMKFQDVATSLLAPRLSDHELAQLESSRPGGMQIDPARYGLLAGLSVDVYFGSGGFLSPRAMMAVPLLGVVTGTGLGFWWELSLALGWTL
ncbi:hypothetical protein [Archangium lansingense]|uniref:Outer membrane protein beta-barrel domain-containing protein n=1 Tax=Archangium lansingense TaxID=2995310 RepID=A0ABT4AGE5_9BACT|nr:hypothetical protein [Archangium lansinium]MCY1080759.1 hypothetical protein [Archangium lansinium]